MKKAIIILFVLLLGGCATVERLMLPDAKKPEKNVLSEPVDGVIITEIDFTKQFPRLADSPYAALSSFYSEANQLYFSYSEGVSKEDSGAFVSMGIYKYDLLTKIFSEIIKIDPKDGYYVRSIVTLNGEIYLCGGYPYKRDLESPYEISVIRKGKKEIILSEITGNYRYFPKLFKVDETSLVFVQNYQYHLGVTSVKVGYKLTRIFSDLSIRSTAGFDGTVQGDDWKGIDHPFVDSVTYNEGFLSFATFKDLASWLHIASINKTTGMFEEEGPRKIGSKTSPQSIGNIGDNWFVVSFGEYEGGWLLDVFSHQSSKKIAAQIFDDPTSLTFLDAFDDKTGIFFGNFENDGTHRLPLGIGRLFLGYVEGNTVKYQRIDGIKFNYDPKSITKLADRKYLVKGEINPNSSDLSYVILEIK